MIYHGKKYHSITIYHDTLFFSQPETNYTIEGIILVDTLIATHCMKYVYIQTFKQPFVIKSMYTY